MLLKIPIKTLLYKTPQYLNYDILVKDSVLNKKRVQDCLLIVDPIEMNHLINLLKCIRMPKKSIKTTLSNNF
jgi:hypothetical protein